MLVTTRKARSILEGISDIDDLFTDEALTNLASILRISDTEKIARLGADVKDAIREFLQWARQRFSVEVSRELAAVDRFAGKCLRGKISPLEVVGVLRELSSDARAVLEDNASARGDTIPSESDLTDPEHGPEALAYLGGLCVTEMRVVPGRKRKGGRRSRPTVEITHAGAPKAAEWRSPENLDTTPERILIAGLAVAYRRATGLMPTRVSYPDPISGFRDFVAAVYGLLGLPTKVDWAIRRYLEAIKISVSPFSP